MTHAQIVLAVSRLAGRCCELVALPSARGERKRASLFGVVMLALSGYVRLIIAKGRDGSF